MNKKVKRLNEVFRFAVSACSKSHKIRNKWHEFYYNDVDDTLSQFDSKQKDFISKSYKIPISTKLSYPIVEQLLSFVTGTKPFPRLIAPEDSVSQLAELYQRLFQATWYECDADDEVKYALRDCLVTGLGWLKVRPNDYYQESTVNVILEYRPWQNIVPDPECRKPDYSDGDYIWDCRWMRVSKAEKRFGIKIKDSDSGFPYGDFLWPSQTVSHLTLGMEWISGEHGNQYCLIRELYEKIETDVYLSDEGDVSLEKPEPTEIPNPEKEALRQQIQEITSAIEQGYKTVKEGAEAEQMGEASLEGAESEEAVGENLSGMEAMDRQNEEAADKLRELEKQAEKMQLMYQQMPDSVPAFVFLLERGETKIVRDVTKIRKKRIERMLFVGDKIVETETLPTDEFPLVPFIFQFNNSFNKVYGPVHYFHDIVKACNKMLAETIYDLQLHGNRKVIYWDGTIEEPNQVEEDWVMPGSWIKIVGDPSLPDGGKPIVVEPSPLNQSFLAMIDRLVQLTEYITGIFGVMQGNPANSPETFGATQSLQSFGTQRVKLYSRTFERSFQSLAYVVVRYLQKYAPRDKKLTYFDKFDEAQSVEILDDHEDIKFKVRVEISKSLPTVREMFANLVGILASNTADPGVSNHLTKYTLSIMDMPEANTLAEELDQIQQMQQQIGQLQQQLEESTKQNKQLTNNLQQSQLARKVESQAEREKAKLREERAREEERNEPAGEEATMDTTDFDLLMNNGEE